MVMPKLRRFIPLQFSICIVILLMSIFFVRASAKGYYSSSSRNQPSISSVRWMESDGDQWESDLDTFGEDAISVRDNGKTWIVSHHITAISFTCNASYPVMWTFERTQFSYDDLFAMKIRTIRRSISSTSVADLSNPKLQQYYSTIDIYGDFNKMTGKYSCQSTIDERSQNNLYLYWQGQSASYLVLAGETLKLNPSENNRSVVLPCYVSYPEGQVSLLKDDGKEFQPMQSHGVKDGIKVNFDSKIGFTLETEQNNVSLLGKYKCVAESPDDYTLIDVEYGKPKPHFDNLLLANAKYYFDAQKDELVCCSNSARPPVFRDIFCSNVATCRIHEHQLLKVENNGQRYKSGGCISSKIYPRETGMFRCKGDAIDVTRHFYTDFSKPGNNAFNTYFSWNSIPSENMMQIIPHFNGTVYNKQIVTVSCLILPSYFSEGIRWGLKRKDESITILSSPDAVADNIDVTESERIFHKMDITISLDISEIICYAPVWNSTDWVHKSINLQVKESVAPEIEDKKTEALYMTVGDTEQILECKSTGTPIPSIKWEKDGQIISGKSKNMWEGNGTSVLIIPSVSLETRGIYRCSASNWAGKDTMVIDVIVEEHSLAWSTASIVTLSVVVVLLAVITGFVVFKLQLKSKIIAHLTRTLFRDVESNAGGQSH